MQILLDTVGAGSLDLGSAALQTLLGLAGVCALAWWILASVARRGTRFGGGSSVRLESELRVGPRQRVAVVAVEGRRLLIGLGEGAAPRLLAELYGPGAEDPLDVSENERLGEESPTVDYEEEQ